VEWGTDERVKKVVNDLPTKRRSTSKKMKGCCGGIEAMMAPLVARDSARRRL